MWADSMVPQDVRAASRSTGREDAEPDGGVAAIFDRAVEVDDLVVGDGGHGGFGEPLADRLGDLSRPDAFGKLLDRSVGQLDPNHESPPALAGLRSLVADGLAPLRPTTPVRDGLFRAFKNIFRIEICQLAPARDNPDRTRVTRWRPFWRLDEHAASR